jgi:bifunctional UDP-N-acetylglucosamine pyrophosphorylase/glucosamine-1-phosphate N-acetyltransferase
MKSEKTKTMHQVFDKPMIEHVYDNLKKAGVDHIVVVVGHGADQIQNYLKDKVEYAMQMPQLGTGHAVMQAECLKGESGKTIIFNGDCPLVQPETIEKLFEKAQDAQFTLLTTVLDDALKYGRIIRDEHDNVEKIVETRGELPNAPKNGAYYYVSDTNTIYQVVDGHYKVVESKIKQIYGGGAQ